MRTRREFGATLLAGLTGGAALGKYVDDTVHGVEIGAVTYSFRDEPRGPEGDSLDAVIRDLKACNVGITELFSPQIERVDTTPEFLRHPQGKLSTAEMREKFRQYRNSPEAKKAREDLRQWRLTTPVNYFQGVKKKFDEAGVRIYAYTMNYSDDFTDEEIDKTFQEARGLGTKIIATSTRVSMAQRLVPFAAKHKIYVSFHGHDQTSDPNEFSTPESFAKALAQSPWYRINLDIGHFTAAGYDPVVFLDQKHDMITHIHVKDRKTNHGPNEPFGQGATPIKEVLKLIEKKKYPIPALVEYEYKGAGTSVEEVTKCLDYMRKALA